MQFTTENFTALEIFCVPRQGHEDHQYGRRKSKPIIDLARLGYRDLSQRLLTAFVCDNDLFAKGLLRVKREIHQVLNMLSWDFRIAYRNT